MKNLYDTVIVGAGPAGLTAALYARRANKTVLVLEKNGFGGQMTYSPKIENFPGFESISGNELADSFVGQVLAQGADIELEEVMSVTKTENNTFLVKTDSSEYESRTVIIATGAKHRLLHVPHEEEFIGNGISFCAVCDGAFYADKDVAVIGGGNSALQEATLLAEQCKSVTMIQNLDFFTGEEKLSQALMQKKNVKAIFGTVVAEFIGGDELTGIKTKRVSDGFEQTLDFDGVFVAIGLAPDNKNFENVAALDRAGYIVSGEDCLTGTNGVFVAGDCRTKKIRQITTASGDGAVAALSAISYIDANF